MAFRGVTILKFVGTVSLGLLTGLSFSLATVTVPTLVTLPSARSAADAFRSLATAATAQLRTLAGVASSAFLLAFVLSPRTMRHPYLLYTALLVLGGRAATSRRLTSLYGVDALDVEAPGGLGGAAAGGSGSPASPSSPALSPLRPHHSPGGSSSSIGGGVVGWLPTSGSHNMEASYEVLGEGDAHSDGGGVGGGNVSDDAAAAAPAAAATTTSAKAKKSRSTSSNSSSGASAAGGGAGINGEEVRASVEVFLKKQIVRTVVSGMAFAMAIVGLWGDGTVVVAAPAWRGDRFY